MNLSIEALEGVVWGEPEYGSHVVVGSHALRKKPIDELSAGDLRLAFSQDIGVAYLKERVLAVLSANPASGEHYDGDLILAVLRSPHFRADIAFGSRVRAVADLALTAINDPEIRHEIENLKRA